MPRNAAPEITAELSKEICDNLATGMMRGDAAALAGVERDTFADWMQRGEDGEEPFAGFRQEITKTELLAQRRLLTKISMAAASDPKVAVWMLEHRWARGWGERERGEQPRRLSPRRTGDQDPKAFAQGIRPNYPLLPWESSSEYQELLGGLLAEHSPQGLTEQRLVEEMASVWWRKTRLRLAEAATHRRGLSRAMSVYGGTVNAALAHIDADDHGAWVVDAVRATDAETARDSAIVKEIDAMARLAFNVLVGGRGDAYETALSALHDSTREWWEKALAQNRKELEEGHAYTADDAGLQRFLESKALPWFSTVGQEFQSRPLIREQAFGEAFDPEQLDSISRYDAHLDRKLDRALATLLRLQELRRAKAG